MWLTAHTCACMARLHGIGAEGARALKCRSWHASARAPHLEVMTNPPAGVRLTMEAVCVMFQIKPVRKPDPNIPGKKVDDFWEAAQKGPLADPKKLLDDLFEFDKARRPPPVLAGAAPPTSFKGLKV